MVKMITTKAITHTDHSRTNNSTNKSTNYSNNTRYSSHLCHVTVSLLPVFPRIAP